MLVKSKIQSEIKEAFIQVMEQEEGREDAINAIADKMSDAIINAIKSVQIEYTTGLISPPTGGAVTGKFNYTIL